MIEFADETSAIDPNELVGFFDAESVSWTRGRSADDWATLLTSSLLLTARLRPLGADDGSESVRGAGRLVGTLRLRSDRVYEAKLHDVVVASDLRGVGISLALVDWSLRHPWAGRVTRYVLETNGAERLYERFGFRVASELSTTHMRVVTDGIVRSPQRRG